MNVEIPKAIKKRLTAVLSDVQQENKSVCIYSAGRLTQSALLSGLFDGVNVRGILDRNSRLHGQQILGIEVMDPSLLADKKPDILVILTSQHHTSIYMQFEKICSELGVELFDACGEPHNYTRFPGVTPENFLQSTLVISDFLPPDNIRCFSTPESFYEVHPTAEEVTVVFESDPQLVNALRKLISLGINYRGIRNADVNWDASPTFDAPQGFCPNVMFKDDAIRSAIDQSLRHSNKWDISTHFDVRDFGNLCQFIRETRHLSGDYVEIGVFRGCSASLAATYMKLTNDTRKMWLLDTYEGFTYNAAMSSADVVWSGTHTETSLEFVQKVIDDIGRPSTAIKLNIIEDDLPSEIQSISVANIDVDIYEAVLCALNKVEPLMVSGGIIVCEDYGHTPELAGAELAVSDFLRQGSRDFIKLYFESGQLCLLKR
jgi:hypothetical protein